MESEFVHLKSVNMWPDIYETFAFDVWGVLFDGKKKIKPICKIYERISENHSTLLISNTSRSSENLKIFLNNNFVPIADCTKIITSGDRASLLLEQLNSDVIISVVGDRQNIEWLNKYNFHVSDDHRDSQVILGVNFLRPHESKDIPALVRSFSAESLFICSNFDKLIPFGDGFRSGCGLVADQCEKIGKKWINSGKPGQEMFSDLCPSVCGPALYFGDSVINDLLPAKRSGLDVAFVTKNPMVVIENVLELFRVEYIPDYFICPLSGNISATHYN